MFIHIGDIYSDSSQFESILCFQYGGSSFDMLPDNIIRLLSAHGILLELVCYITHIFNVNFHDCNISQYVTFKRSQLKSQQILKMIFIYPLIMCLLYVQALFPYSNLNWMFYPKYRSSDAYCWLKSNLLRAAFCVNSAS